MGASKKNSSGSQKEDEEGRDKSHKKKARYEYSNETYVLKVILQNRFNTKERDYIMNKALLLVKMADCPNLGKLMRFYKSSHSFFMVFKDA